MYIRSWSETLSLRLTASAMIRGLASGSRSSRGHPRYAVATVGIELGRLPERSFGLEEPEPVQLTDPLIDKGLHLGNLTLYGNWTLPVFPIRTAAWRGPSSNTSPWIE